MSLGPTSSTLPQPPLTVHGTTASYYTGKLEAVLRAKGIDYRLQPFSQASLRRAARITGVMQIPQVECPDGSWWIDSTLILEHLERTCPEPALSPHDPVLRFLSRLIEDYADEWLWRPAMHYRWSFPETARLMSAWLAEHLDDRPGPQWLKRLYWRRRQFATFVRGDGVTAENRGAVESVYLQLLDALEPVFARRPFLFGERPFEADFGLFGPMFRHFSSDPAPARILRERAPAVLEWVARLWNVQPDRVRRAPMPLRVPEDLGALWRAITQDYLPYLESNAAAFAGNERRVRYSAGGAVFDEPMKPYRVWCRDRLHRELSGLDEGARAQVREILAADAVVDRLLMRTACAVAAPVRGLPIRGDGSGRPVLDSWWRG